MPRPDDPHERSEWEYGVWKRDAEDRLALPGAPPSTRLRIPMVNGERDYYRRIEGYLWRLLDGSPLLLPDGGTQPTRHVYGDDVARAIVGLLGNPKAQGEAFNLAQRETPTLREILELLAGLLGARLDAVAVPAEAIEQAGLSRVEVSPFSGRWMSFLDPSKAEQALGFAHTPLEEYLGRIVASFRAHPPADRPKGYARRAEELALLAR